MRILFRNVQKHSKACNLLYPRRDRLRFSYLLVSRVPLMQMHGTRVNILQVLNFFHRPKDLCFIASFRKCLPLRYPEAAGQGMSNESNVKAAAMIRIVTCQSRIQSNSPNLNRHASSDFFGFLCKTKTIQRRIPVGIYLLWAGGVPPGVAIVKGRGLFSGPQGFLLKNLDCLVSFF